MYLTFYGLKEKPFNTTPEPKFLYLTPGHREALAQLVYSVQESAAALAGVAVSPLRLEATPLITLARHVRDLFLR